MILFFIIFSLGIYNSLARNTDLVILFILLLILSIEIVFASLVNIYYRFAYFSYEKLRRDTLISRKLTLKKIKILSDIPIGNKVKYRPEIIGFNLLCLDENGKKFRLIFPFKEGISFPIPKFKFSKEFRTTKEQLLKEWEFSFLKHTKIIIDSTLSLENICNRCVK